MIENWDETTMKIVDKQFTKTRGIADDDGTLIWLVDVAEGRALFKQPQSFQRNPRVQLFVDEIKPEFELQKIGHTLVKWNGRWACLIKFYDDAFNLMQIEKKKWMYERGALHEITKMVFLDLVTVNNNRLKRNVLWVGPGKPLLAIDEEKALDFEGMVTFRMDDEIRKAIIASLRTFGLKAYLERVAGRMDRVVEVARKYFDGSGLEIIEKGLRERFASAEKEFFRFLDSKYSDGKKMGIKSKRARGMKPWDEPSVKKPKAVSPEAQTKISPP